MTVIASKAGRAAYLAATEVDPEQAAGLVGVTQPRGMLVRCCKDGDIRTALVGVYRASEAGIEDDPSVGRWATVCERHHSCIVHETRALAFFHSREPDGWCEPCRDLKCCPTCTSDDRNRTSPAFYRASGSDCTDPFHDNADLD